MNLRPVGPAVGVPRHEMHHSPGPVPAADELVHAWETAVLVYGQVQARADAAPLRDVAAAREMTEASAQIARTWRELLAARQVPLWVSSAIETAADMFEEQADAWRAREGRAWQAQQQGENQ
ncbi:MAG TPA: hypothetical protein VG317_13345 [Pseudonocardiaceae bacterium]|jgi:hypothetical protein|nr:hypothetical protein [Pseudonocardiaceae bacterium]